MFGIGRRIVRCVSFLCWRPLSENRSELESLVRRYMFRYQAKHSTNPLRLAQGKVQEAASSPAFTPVFLKPQSDSARSRQTDYLHSYRSQKWSHLCFTRIACLMPTPPTPLLHVRRSLTQRAHSTYNTLVGSEGSSHLVSTHHHSHPNPDCWRLLSLFFHTRVERRLDSTAQGPRLNC